MTKDVDDLLNDRVTVGFPADDAAILRALAHKRRISISDLIRAAVYRELEAILPATSSIPARRRKSCSN